MIFRLYTSSTIEEKLLRLAEHNVTIDRKLQNISRSTSDVLLTWGTTYLFNKLDEFHNASGVNTCSEECLFDELLEEFVNLITHKVVGWKEPMLEVFSYVKPKATKIQKPQYEKPPRKITRNERIHVSIQKTTNNLHESVASKPVTAKGASKSQSFAGDSFWSDATTTSFHDLLKLKISKLCELESAMEMFIRYIKNQKKTYVLEDSIRETKATNGLDLAKFLDVGIKVSGKLQFLDLILPELRKQKLRVLILYQDSASIGYILDDFLCQRFGEDSYERIDGVGILDKFKEVDFRRWQKKMYFLLSSMSVMYVLTTPIPDDGGDNPTVEQVRKRAKWDNNDYVCRELWDSLEAKYMTKDASSKKFLVSNFINYKMTDSKPVVKQYNELLGILGRFKHTLKHLKEELTLVELGSHMRIEESHKVEDSGKPKSNNVVDPPVVNMVEHNNSFRYNDNKGTRKHHDNTRADPNKKAKLLVGNVAKLVTLKGIAKVLMLAIKPMVQAQRVQWMDDDVAWRVDSGATVHVCKDRYWFKTYESLNDGSILHMQNESTALVHGRGCLDLRLNIVNDNIGSAMSTTKLNDSIRWHARLGHVHFKRMQDMSKDRFCYVYLLHSKDEALDKFKVFKTKVELQQGSLIKRFRTDRGGEYIDTLYFQYVGIIHETTAPYTSQQNGISERKNKVLKEMVNSMLSYSGLSQVLWGEAMAVVRLPYLKLKTLGERGIEYIFLGYAEHSKVFRFFSVPRPNLRIPNGTKDISGLVVPE
ncbi:zinc finger, CCHC-type containing protein [Tanacetum coccineum]